MERIFKKGEQYNRDTSKLDRERINKIYPMYKNKLPMCLGMAHIGKKGKIVKTGLFNWVTSWEQYQIFIDTIECQLEELKNNEAFFYNKMLKIEKEIGIAEHRELYPEKEPKTTEEIELLKTEKEHTQKILKTINSIEKDTKNMWLITIETIGRKQKLKKIAKIEDILKGAF